MRIDLTDYKEFVQSGLYSLTNESTKEVYIGHTTNFMIALERSISQITRGISPIIEFNKPGERIAFTIIETNDDFYTKLLRHNYWCNDYTDRGYKVLNKREAIDLACKAIVEEDLVHVVLYNRTTKILVGIFSNMDEAKEFTSLYYPNKKVENIVYATNELTKDHINEY